MGLATHTKSRASGLSIFKTNKQKKQNTFFWNSVLDTNEWVNTIMIQKWQEEISSFTWNEAGTVSNNALSQKCRSCNASFLSITDSSFSPGHSKEIMIYFLSQSCLAHSWQCDPRGENESYDEFVLWKTQLYLSTSVQQQRKNSTSLCCLHTDLTDVHSLCAFYSPHLNLCTTTW